MGSLAHWTCTRQQTVAYSKFRSLKTKCSCLSNPGDNAVVEDDDGQLWGVDFAKVSHFDFAQRQTLGLRYFAYKAA
eukprot:3419808-Amphidinium_carterae.1